MSQRSEPRELSLDLRPATVERAEHGGEIYTAAVMDLSPHGLQLSIEGLESIVVHEQLIVSVSGCHDVYMGEVRWARSTELGLLVGLLLDRRLEDEAWDDAA